MLWKHSNLKMSQKVETSCTMLSCLSTILGGWWWFGGWWSDKTKLISISTQEEVVVEVWLEKVYKINLDQVGIRLSTELKLKLKLSLAIIPDVSWEDICLHCMHNVFNTNNIYL